MNIIPLLALCASCNSIVLIVIHFVKIKSPSGLESISLFVNMACSVRVLGRVSVSCFSLFVSAMKLCILC